MAVFFWGQELMDPAAKPPGTVAEGTRQRRRDEGSETKEARNEGGTDEETRHCFAKSC